MEIQVNDFNYYVKEGNIYQFYFLGNDNKIHEINNYGISVNPMITIRSLTLQGLRYNPHMNHYGKEWI